MTPERFQRLCDTLNRRQPDLTVVTDAVHKGRNISAIVRSCDAVGIHKMHSVIPHTGYKNFRGTAMGSGQWVEVQRHTNIEDVLLQLKAQNFQIVAADVGEKSISYRDVDYTVPTAVVMGNEKAGLSAKAKALCDQYVHIPMVGMVESYNVSVACGIILNEALYQKDQAGHYNEVKLAQAEYQRLLFEWGHEKVKRFCQRHKLDYPPLREDGEIDQPAQWYAQAREEIARREALKQ